MTPPITPSDRERLIARELLDSFDGSSCDIDRLAYVLAQQYEAGRVAGVEPMKCALTALCGVRGFIAAYGHRNMLKDVDTALDGLRDALLSQKGTGDQDGLDGACQAPD